MRRRYLFGPISAEFADKNLHRARRAGDCLAFSLDGSTDLSIGSTDRWEDILARLPNGWEPDFIVLAMAYTTIPAGLWSAPVPRVALAGDWNLLWHGYRRRLRHCELLLSDAAGVEVMRREGLEPALTVQLGTAGRDFGADGPPDDARDIDILFVGNMNPDVQLERLPLLARLARLNPPWRVVFHAGAVDEACRALLRRTRIVFTVSNPGEWDSVASEATATGALLFQDARTCAANLVLRDRLECVTYDPANLEIRLNYYLEHEDERLALTEAARTRAVGFGFESSWQQVMEQIESAWPALIERAARRVPSDPQDELLDRTWQALSSTIRADPSLVDDLGEASRADSGSASLHNAMALAIAFAGRGRLKPVAIAEAMLEPLRRAVEEEPDHLLAGLNLAEVLVVLGRIPAAIDRARRTLARLDERAEIRPATLDAIHFPPLYDAFRVEWERAAWSNAGQPGAEARAKSALLRWRLHALLAEHTDDVAHGYEAVLARPDLTATRARLGVSLARSGRLAEAVGHLRQAAEANPFNRSAARSLFEVLGETGQVEARNALAEDRRRLARSVPDLVKPEPWFESPRRAEPGAIRPAPVSVSGRPGRPRVTLSMIVKNEEQNLPACLATAADLVDEIVIADTGSTDRTRELAARFGARVCEAPWSDSFSAARNASLEMATGRWVLWLDADDRIDDENRRKLASLLAGLGNEVETYSLKVRSTLGSAPGAATLMDQARLFRNHPDVRWRYRIHEQILPSARNLGGGVQFTDVIIDHVGYKDPNLRRRKLDRNLRLLELDHAEHPNDPFVLFNLGWTYLDFKRSAEALPLFRRSLERSSPDSSIVRKLYALLAQTHRKLRQRDEALAACREGLARLSGDAELHWLEASLLREAGDLAGAEASLRRVLASKPGAFFAKIPVGLIGYKTRHELAEIYVAQGKTSEAEAEWLEALDEQPDHKDSVFGLADLYLNQQRWNDLEGFVGRIADRPGQASNAPVIRARGHLARREFAEARRILEETIARWPKSLGPREILTHVLLQEDRDHAAAEQALRDVLSMAPNHAESKHNLSVLLRRKRPAPAS